LDRRPIGNEKAPLAIAKWACDLSNAQGEKAEWARHVPGQARSFARQEPAFTMPETDEKVTQAELERRGWPMLRARGPSRLDHYAIFMASNAGYVECSS
jgi:hypothetical protein